MQIGLNLALTLEHGGAGAPTLDMTFTGTGNALDSRITFTRASTGTYFDSAGVLTSAAINAPRFDYNPATLAAQGLLIEEQRTNSIRNNTMQGAVAGTPGTLPTNWSVTGTANGLTRTISTGTENGISYIDVRYAGTTTAASFCIIRPEDLTQIAATSGQTWTSSLYMRIAAGSTANITALENWVIGANSGGFIVESNQVTPVITGTMTRFTVSRTMNNANTAFVYPYVAFTFGNGVAIDITLRIGLPQLEQGAFATSVIPTTTTALTRNTDVASVNTLSPWFNATEGTFVASAVMNGSVSTQNTVWRVDNTTDNERMFVRSNSSLLQFAGIAGGSGQWDLRTGNTLTLGAQFNSASAYKVNDIANAFNGGNLLTDTSATIPTATRVLLGGDNGGGYLNGYLRRVSYFPRRLSNAELQSLTA